MVGPSPHSDLGIHPSLGISQGLGLQSPLHGKLRGDPQGHRRKRSKEKGMDSILERRLGQGHLDLPFPMLNHYMEEMMVEHIRFGRDASKTWSLRSDR